MSPSGIRNVCASIVYHTMMVAWSRNEGVTGTVAILVSDILATSYLRCLPGVISELPYPTGWVVQNLKGVLRVCQILSKYHQSEIVEGEDLEEIRDLLRKMAIHDPPKGNLWIHVPEVGAPEIAELLNRDLEFRIGNRTVRVSNPSPEFSRFSPFPKAKLVCDHIQDVFTSL